MIPSIGGCIKCSKNCLKCYEGNAFLNFTAKLIFDRPILTVKNAFNY